MKDQSEIEYWSSRRTEGIDREIRRANARLNHFRGVAVSVLGEAQRLLSEVWDELQDSRSYEEILESKGSFGDRMPESDRGLLLEKLHLLGIQIDYARRLCEGSVGNELHEEGDQ